MQVAQRAGAALAGAVTGWQWHAMLPVLYTFHWGTAEMVRRYRDAVGRLRGD